MSVCERTRLLTHPSRSEQTCTCSASHLAKSHPRIVDPVETTALAPRLLHCTPTTTSQNSSTRTCNSPTFLFERGESLESLTGKHLGGDQNIASTTKPI